MRAARPRERSIRLSLHTERIGVNSISDQRLPETSHAGALPSSWGTPTWRLRIGCGLVCALALVVGGVGLNDEGYASTGGDMARYLMDGAYIRDVVADGAFMSPFQLLDYTRHYYARYPALSLGHHPVLLPIFEAPLFGLLGVSVFAARLVPLASLVIAAVFLCAIVNRRFGPLAATAAGALFVSSPMVVASTRAVMAELPSIALLLACAYYLERFSETGRRRALVACAVTAILALYARPMAVLVTPALAIAALVTIPFDRLLKRDVLTAVAAVVILSAPAVALPLALSPSNVEGVMSAGKSQTQSEVLGLLHEALYPQFAWPVMIVAAAGAVWAIVRRDARSLLLLLWVVCVAPALLFFHGANGVAPRYTLFWVPAICALAGSLLAEQRFRGVRLLVGAVLVVGVAMQIADKQTIAERMEQAGGYEEAAQFVLAGDPGPTVLFSGDIDTGFFTFFVRKHDPERRLVVLRSDKILTTSLMGKPSVEERIERPDQIYETLHRYGTRYVVIEDRPSKARVLEWLREELKSPRFIERRRIPIRTTDPRLRGTSLAIFELRDPTPPAADAMLSLHLPVVGQSVDVALRDLIDRKYLR